MSIIPMPQPDETDVIRERLVLEATQFLLRVRSEALAHLESYGCAADPRLTSLVAWTNDQLQVETSQKAEIRCGRCGAIYQFLLAVLSQRPAESMYCPFCSARLPAML